MVRQQDVAAWMPRYIRKLEAELEKYRTGELQAWSARRIVELELENAELRNMVAGQHSEEGQRILRNARIQYLVDHETPRHRDEVTARVRWAVLERDGHRCRYCRYCGVTADHARIGLDHVVPVVDGGSNDVSNLVAACDDCNAGKGDRALVGALPGTR